jgi:dihydrofolate reductase
MRCSVFIATSLDGYIARADGSIDYLSIVERAGEDYGYRAFFDSIDTLVIGRSTYDLALGFNPWPYAGKRCIVLTHSAREAKHGEEFFSGEPRELAERLKASGTQRAYVDGGAVIQQFLAARLIDDLTVSVIPVLLGAGIRLFGDTQGDLPLELHASKNFESGLVQLTYRSRNLG